METTQFEVEENDDKDNACDNNNSVVCDLVGTEVVTKTQRIEAWNWRA